MTEHSSSAVTRHPVLPLRDIVVFPHMAAPLYVGREKSVRALESVMRDNRQILLATQREASNDDPTPEDIYQTGVIASVLQLLKLPDGTVKVLVEGKSRARIRNFVENEAFYEAEVELLEESEGDPQIISAFSRTLAEEFDKYAKLNRNVPQEAAAAVAQIEDPNRLADAVAAHLVVKISEKQSLLETLVVSERMERIYGLMANEIGVLQMDKKIKSRVKRQMEKTQREYYLNEQMKAIQRELGEGEDGRDEAGELEKRVDSISLSKEAREKALAEIKKLRQMPPLAAEATVVRNYLDWLLGIPWNKNSKVKKDLEGAEKILDADHHGLEKVKERILEYLAVQQRKTKLKGPILCLVGPPGVGKTSLGKSLAKATNREFIRISLGGVRDEAEIRGHRRTYIGSMPGKIVQALRKAKTSNPLILLDEIDKMGQDFRGDPASAMLEVLDPEQNSTFNDHYLEVDYDLSNVMFVTTANTYNMPRPLLDRMEVISLSGYTEDEKVQISRKHLLPKQVEANGLKPKEFSISDEALRDVIRLYTRESGVRNLERELARLCRKAVTRILREKIKEVKVEPKDLETLLGPARYRFGVAEKEDQVGVVTGLAWTEVGGELLSIEALRLPGKGRMKTTGKLGEVMKESIEAAASYVRAQAPKYGIRPPLFEKVDIHVHVPEGATPKDGPSAGIGMTTAIVSVLSGIPVRKDVAMTGEVTLRGNVLAIGGLKEKLLAALRGGIKTVLIPQENEKDLAEIPANVKEGMKIIPVSTMEQVLDAALTRHPEPISWSEADQEAAERAAYGGPPAGEGGAARNFHA